MKRLNKKQIIIIISVAIVIIALAIAGIIFGINNGKKKETTKNDDKIESVEKDEADEEEEEETDETVRADDKSEEDTTTESETPEVEEPKPESPKTETPSNANQNQNQNNNNTGNNSGNSGGNTTTQPSTPTPTPTPEPSPYAGMYKPYDSASVERFNQCGSILRGGLAGQYMQWRETFIDYFSGAIILSNGNTDNAWMYVKIRNWSTNEGSEETAPTFDELPSLAKQCFVALAPEGGLELYNKVNAMILQYGDPRNVPTQGTISESIPGLSVTLTQGKAGIEIRFWAE